MNNVTILGGGVLGTQIAFQCAYTGKNVTIWLRSEDSKTRTIPKLENLKETYIKEINLMSENGYELPGLKISDKFDKDKSLSRVNEAFSNIKIELDLKNSLSTDKGDWSSVEVIILARTILKNCWEILRWKMEAHKEKNLSVFLILMMKIYY